MLKSWDEVAEQADWKAILLGNGASQQVSSGFSYGSLYEVARSGQQRLQRADEQVFQGLGTQDFERVLRALRDALIVNAALGLPTNAIGDRYRAIQRALAEAVARTHVPWAPVQGILPRMRRELVRHRFVFTTNYDLLVYWAVLCEEPRPRDVKDFFWTEADGRWLRFDPSNTSVGPDVARVLYVHGGLHLYSLPDGTSAKYVPDEGENLLDVFQGFMTQDVEMNEDRGVLPLIVTESDARNKRAVIESSAYLNFAYEQLATCSSSLVIFGHSLGDSDSHIVTAISRHRDRPIAIAIHPSNDPDRVDRRMDYFRDLMREPPLYFFDSTTHPLGDPALRIDSGGSSP